MTDSVRTLRADEDYVVHGRLELPAGASEAARFALRAAPGAGELRIAADGTWAFLPGAAFDALNDGDSRFLSFAYVVADEGRETEFSGVLEVRGRSDAGVPPEVKALLSGRAWNAEPGQPATVAYHFAEAGELPDYYDADGLETQRDGFAPFDAAQRSAARAALAAWAEAGGVRFEETEDAGRAHIVFGIAELGEGANGWAFYPGACEGGDVWIDPGAAADLGPGGFGYAVLLHEIGHALGLRHPDEHGGGHAYDVYDARSIMAWRPGHDGAVPAAPAPVDYAALHWLYGSTPPASAVPPPAVAPTGGAWNTVFDPYRISVDDTTWWRGEIDWRYDVDYFEFYAYTGYDYTISAKDRHNGVVSDVSPDIRIVGGGSGFTDTGLTDAEIGFSVNRNGWVVVSIRDWDSGAFDNAADTGYYWVQVGADRAALPDFESASWSVTSADHGDRVTLTANFDAALSGYEVAFSIWEYNGDGRSYGTLNERVAVLPATESGSRATARWTAEHRDDSLLDPRDPDPEYFFDVWINREYAGSSPLSALLEVDQGGPEFSSANWGVTAARHGDRVTLTANFDGSVAGRDVEFAILEDNGHAYYDTWETSIDATESGSRATAQWTARYSGDDWRDIAPESQYYFGVFLNGALVGLSSRDLDVGEPGADLSSASWSTASAGHGETVTLTAVFDGSIEGREVEFDIWEYTDGRWRDIYETTVDATESGSRATAQWTAKHQTDVFGFGDPEYEFVVYVDGVAVGFSEDLLDVSADAPGGDPDPDPPLEDGVFSYTQIAQYLTDGYWTAIGRARRAFDADPGDALTVNISGLSGEGQTLARAALASWANVTGLRFQETSGAAQIVFGDEGDRAYSSSITQGQTILSSTVNVSRAWLQAFGTSLDSYSFQTYIHEIGHALGLGHAGAYNGTAQYGINNHYLNDSWQATAMSYFPQQHTSSFSFSHNTWIAATGASYAYAVTPMAADILAIHDLYGAPSGIRAGDTVYGRNSTAGGYMDNLAALSHAVTWTIYDGGGVDTLDLSGFAADQKIDLRAESAASAATYVSDAMGAKGNLMIAPGTVIENAVGGDGNDTITGNDAANRLAGGGGNDRLQGGRGDDTLVGGNGRDTAVYSGRRGDYEVTDAGNGVWTVRHTASSATEGTDRLEGMEVVHFDGDGGQRALVSGGARSYQEAPAFLTQFRLVIAAEDRRAREPGDDGSFVFSLNGQAPAGGVTLHYSITGTAENGTDYASLPGQVLIDRDKSKATVAIDVTDDSAREGAETVTVTLTHASGPNAGRVAADTAASATIVIVDDEPPPPRVALTNLTLVLSETADTRNAIRVADIDLQNGGDGARGLELAGPDAAMFEMNAAQTELYLKAGAALDHDANPVLDATVRRADAHGVAAGAEILVEPVAPAQAGALKLFVNGTAENNVIALGSSLATRTNGGLGADRYILLASQTGQASIEDRSGANVLALDDGVRVASAELRSGTLFIDLAGGPEDEIEVVAATAYRFAAGTQADLDWRAFLALIEDGYTVSGAAAAPAARASTGSLKVFANGNPGRDVFSFGYDLEVRSNGGLGNDEYRLTRFQAHDVEISDRSGTNLVVFDDGVSVSGFRNRSGTFEFTLANDATVDVAAAFANRYKVADGAEMAAADFQTWVQARSGAFVAGAASAAPAVSTAVSAADAGRGALAGTDGADTFVLRFDSSGGAAPADWEGGDGIDRILDFNPGAGDRIRFTDANDGPGRIDTLAEFRAAFDPDARPGAAARSADGGAEAVSLGFGDGLAIYRTDALDPALFDPETGEFRDADAFVAALGGADALLFG